MATPHNPTHHPDEAWILSLPTMAPMPVRTTSLSSTQFPAYMLRLKISTYADTPRPATLHNVRTLSWNETGSLIATGAADRTLRVWNPERPKAAHSTELRGHTGAIERVAFNPSTEHELASCGADGTVRFWDVRTKSSVGEVKVGGEAFTLAWKPDGTDIVVGRKVFRHSVNLEDPDVKEKALSYGNLARERGHRVDIWANPFLQDDALCPVSRTNMAVIATHRQNVQTNQTTFSNTGSHLFVTTGDGRVKIVDYEKEFKQIHELNAHTSSCYTVALSSTGTHLAIGGGDALISLWDTKEWICVRTLEDMTGPVRSVDFSFDGSYVVGGSDEGNKLSIAHTETGEYVHHIETSAPALFVAWHPLRYVLAYSVDGQGLKIAGGMSTPVS